MPLIHLNTPASDNWSAPVTLESDTLFQVRAGSVLLDIGAEAAPVSTDGFRMSADADLGLRQK